MLNGYEQREKDQEQFRLQQAELYKSMKPKDSLSTTMANELGKGLLVSVSAYVFYALAIGPRLGGYCTLATIAMYTIYKGYSTYSSRQTHAEMLQHKREQSANNTNKMKTS